MNNVSAFTPYTSVILETLERGDPLKKRFARRLAYRGESPIFLLHYRRLGIMATIKNIE